MRRRPLRFAGTLIALFLSTGAAGATPESRQAPTEPQAPKALQQALDTVWTELAPYVERSKNAWNDGRNIGKRWHVFPDRWRSDGALLHKRNGPFLKSLRTVIEQASCHGHPVALRSLFEVRRVITLPFLTVEHRLLLEWRSLHLGMELGFFEAIRHDTVLPRVALDRPKPVFTGTEVRDLAPPRSMESFDLAYPSPQGNPYRLFELWSLLRDQRYEEAYRHIPELSELCLGVTQPWRKKFEPIEIQSDPVTDPKTAG